MAKRQRDHDAAGPSQQKHICATAMTALVLAAASAPAYAEVCDKMVGESWSHEHGVAWLLNPTVEQVRVYLVTAAIVAIALVTRKPWIIYIAAALVALYAFAAIPNLSDSVFVAAVNEGCQSIRTSIADVSIFITLSLLCVWSGHRSSRQRVST